MPNDENDYEDYEILNGGVYKLLTTQTVNYMDSGNHNTSNLPSGTIFIAERSVLVDGDKKHNILKIVKIITNPETDDKEINDYVEGSSTSAFRYIYYNQQYDGANIKLMTTEEIEKECDTDEFENACGYRLKIDEKGQVLFVKSGSEGEKPNYIDDFFTTNYISEYEDQSNYKSNLDGLQVKDIRNILGAPHQFLPETDARIDSGPGNVGSNSSLGRIYTNKILKYAPILFITPGVPNFMSGFSKQQKATVIENLFNAGNSDDLNILLNNYSGRYYTLKFAYTSYYYYVNFMLRNASIFLGIDQETLDGEKLYKYNWLSISNTSAGDALKEGNEGNIIEGAFKLVGKNNSGCLAFYADCGTSADESFSNSTNQSQLASTINGFSDQGRELNFLIGNVGSITGLELDKMMTSETLFENRENLTNYIDKLLGKNNIFSNILNKVQTVLAGGHIDFPELWSDSSFSRSYSCKMKLVSPTGDKLSVFLNILVPIYHILALTLPRQSDGQSYFSPFLVRAYYKGMFNVNMGLISDLSITKGDQGEWTADGIPTVAEVSFSIRDLYDTMFMSKFTDNLNIMSNIAELDYIANSCGININDQDIGRLAKMYASNIIGTFSDKVEIGIFGSLSQWVNQKLNNIFGVF